MSYERQMERALWWAAQCKAEGDTDGFEFAMQRHGRAQARRAASWKTIEESQYGEILNKLRVN